jgi:hypothetical protein
MREHEQKLLDEINALLAGSLGGLSPRIQAGIARVERPWMRSSPAIRGLRAVFVYALLLCGGLWLVSDGTPQPHLFWLSAWGALYLGWAVASAQATTERVVELLRGAILPALSADTLQSVSEVLARRFRQRRIDRIAWGIALAGLAIAGFALWSDITRAGAIAGQRRIEIQLLFWSAGWLMIFLTGARCTYVAQFYAVFAEHLMAERDKIFPLAPSATALVRDISELGRTIFAFWIGISLSILSLTLLFLSRGGGGALGLPLWEGVSLFGALVMPITLSFSLLFATLVFLRSEGALRRSVAQVNRTTLAEIQAEAMRLLAAGDRITDAQAARLKLLVERHDAVAQSGSYKSLFLQALSVIPLVSSLALTIKAMLDIAGRS